MTSGAIGWLRELLRINTHTSCQVASDTKIGMLHSQLLVEKCGCSQEQLSTVNQRQPPRRIPPYRSNRRVPIALALGTPTKLEFSKCISSNSSRRSTSNQQLASRADSGSRFGDTRCVSVTKMQKCGIAQRTPCPIVIALWTSHKKFPQTSSLHSYLASREKGGTCSCWSVMPKTISIPAI